MTAQIPDEFIFKGKKYELIGIKGDDLFSPETFGMEPEMIHTACYRGFYAKYRFTREVLYLSELTINEKNNNYLPINGIKPIGNPLHEMTYRKLNLIIPFTGKIRMARNFLNENYVHMGFQSPWAYETVLDITIKEGKVIDIKDRSEEFKLKWQEIKQQEINNVVDWINDAFSLDMDLE